MCVDDQEALRPLQVAAGLHGGKNDSEAKTGRIRGTATGTVFRRLVAKTWARQFGTAVEAACVPFQFALSTRTGVGHTVRAATEALPRMTVLSGRDWGLRPRVEGCHPCFSNCNKFLDSRTFCRLCEKPFFVIIMHVGRRGRTEAQRWSA